MKINSKRDNKLCFILYTISSLLLIAIGIFILTDKGFSDWNGITNIALGITFGSLAFIYYKKYKSEK